MKSLVSRLHLVADGLLADFHRAYPSLGSEFVRDKRALASYVDERGLGFFTLDLPNLRALLLEGIESDSLTLKGPCSRRVSKRVRVPAFLRGLWLLVFDNSGSLRLDPDPTAMDFIGQFSELAKKVTLTCTPARNRAAVKEFVDVESSLPEPDLRWDSDEGFDWSDVCSLSFSSFDRLRQYSADNTRTDLFEDDIERLSAEDASLLERLDTICRDVSTRLGLFDAVEYDTLLRSTGRPSGTKNGPGAVSDLQAKEEKFSFANWPEKLQAVFPIDFFGHRPHEVGSTYTNLEHASKLIAVPKTAKTPRLIASEPSYYQWCQQLVRRFLEDGIRTIFGDDVISFHDQSKSHPMVRLGSLDKSLATVDLSSASDRLSCRVVERAFRGNLSLLNALHATRTRVVGPSKRVDIDFARLRKFSTMGSALTFPIQSLVFACVVLASLPGNARLDSQLARYRKQIRVYGDDIVIPVEGYANLVRLLTLLKLKVNEKKSFSRGHFRESCGFDAFLGVDVTPVKPRSLDPTNPEGRMSILELSNNLFSKGLWIAAERAFSLLPQETSRSLPVVGPLSGTFGKVSFSGADVSHLKSRWNARLHRNEVLCTTYISRTKTTFTEGTDYSLQALHTLEQRCPSGAPVVTMSRRGRVIMPSPSKATLGRVVEAVTRERRSWVVTDVVLCSG